MLDIRRGISRIGVVSLVLWELVVLSALLVWVCWRVLLWIARGFVGERA